MEAVGRPTRHVVEHEGFLAVWRLVEFATADSRGLKRKSTEKLVIVDGLIFDVAGGRLDDEYAKRIGVQGLEHDAPDGLVASVSKRNGPR